MPQTAKPKTTRAPGKAIAIVEVPLGDPLGPSDSRHARVDVHLRGAHGATLCRLRSRLNAEDVRLRDGRHVHTTIDAVKWLLEQIDENATE